jgi:TolA-binding protein
VIGKVAAGSPLAEWVGLALQFVRRWRNAVLGGVGIAIITAGGGAGYWWYQNRQEMEARRALIQANALLRGEGKSPANPDEAIKRLSEVAERHRGTRSAGEALVRLGNLQLGAGRFEDAIGSYGLYLAAYPRGELLLMAGVGRAYAQEAKGDLQGAAQTLSEVLDRRKEDPLAGEAYMGLGRVLEGLKKPEEALRIYGQVVEGFGQTQWAQRALQRMTILRAK